jgi:hypothetical protein
MLGFAQFVEKQNTWKGLDFTKPGNDSGEAQDEFAFAKTAFTREINEISTLL